MRSTSSLKGQARFGTQARRHAGQARGAASYLRFVLKTCSEAGLRGESDEFMQDAVRAELLNNFRDAERQLLRHRRRARGAHRSRSPAACATACCELHTAGAAAACARNAERAKEWESRADELVNRARGVNSQAVPANFFRTMVETADDVADELEDAAFHLTLLPARTVPADSLSELPALGELLVHGAQEYVKAVESARHVRRGGAREDVQDFLSGIHRIQQIERETDEAQRGIKRALLGGETDARAAVRAARRRAQPGAGGRRADALRNADARPRARRRPHEMSLHA